jgi:hypothetical protein
MVNRSECEGLNKLMTKSGILSQIGYQIEKPSSEEHNIAYQITRSV